MRVIPFAALILITGSVFGDEPVEVPTSAVIDVDDDVDVAIVVGGWNSNKPILLRSDGVPCPNRREIPEYPQVPINWVRIVRMLYFYRAGY